MTSEQPGADAAVSATRTGGAAPRTLAEDLRGWDDEALAALLRDRPDLLTPVPSDLTRLATRLSVRASVLRALERLDLFTLRTAQALAAAPDGCDRTVLLHLLAGEPGADTPDDAEPVDRAAVERALPGALDLLRRRALAWGRDSGLHLVRTVRDVLAPTAAHPGPTGLGPALADAAAGMSPGRLQELLADTGLPSTHDPVSAVAALTALFTDRARLAALLAGAPPAAGDVLRRLRWGPPVGTVPDAGRPVRAAGAQNAVEWLLARGLLLPSGERTVVLPREVALHLRGGRAHRSVEPSPPALEPVHTRDPAAVDAAAAGQASTAVRTVRDLLDRWNTGGPAVLRAGGLGVRDLRRTAAALDTTETLAALWLELARTAGLLATDGEESESWAPTPAYDEWLRRPVAVRWALLARAWLATTRVSFLAGVRDARGRVCPALGPDLDRGVAPEVRRAVLEALAALPPGGTVPAGPVLAALRWARPLRGGAHPAEAGRELREDLVHRTLEEAELLGVTGRGALAAHGRALLAGEDPVPVLEPLLPEPLDHVLLQADLTAIAPGPLRAPLAQALELMADVESKGAATVYRFTPASVRRALDAGRTASELHAFLAEHARTPVPQPLAYLVDDVARRHGRLRVGAASSYLRCDDDALLTEILADRRADRLRLRRLAPTVLAAQAEPEAVLERLREMGYAPAAESPRGDVVITRPGARRTPPRTPPAPVPDGPRAPDAVLLAAAVRAIRAGDRAATAVRRNAVTGPAAGAGGPRTTGRLPRTAAAETLAAVQTAVLTGERVWIGYVNAEGAASQRVVAPVKVEGGYVTAYDHLREEVRTFALHRITGVAEIDEPA